METLINLLNGVSYGMILFIIASGLSLIFGVMGILNLAHGALYVLGAYIGLSLAGYGFNFALAALVAGLAVGVVGFVLERLFLGRLYKQINEQVLLTLGVVFILSNTFLWVWGPMAMIGKPPVLLSNAVQIGDTSYPQYRLAIVLIGLLIFFGLWYLQEKTRLGATIRAGMDDKQMTIGMGINYNMYASFVFFMGAFLGGLAGYLGTPVIGIQPGISLDILLFAMIIIVVGGVGSIQGALIGSILIGVVDAFGRAYFPNIALYTVYLTMIIILIVRPSGLLGRTQ